MILFILCVTVVPVLAGLACMRLKREKETMTLTEAYMMGLLVLFLLGEVAACLVIKLDGSFSFYCKILSGAVIVWCLLSVLLGWKMGKELLRHVPVCAGDRKRYDGRDNRGDVDERYGIPV